MSHRFEYIINFENGPTNSFVVNVDPETFIISDDDSVEAPEWTRLEYQKCQHCPYQTTDRKYCPVAKNLAHASEVFKEERSYTKLTVFVKSDERTYGKRTDLQTALFSLFGLIMASSSCSHLHLFKSMARYHLPFSTVDETKVRVLGMYLINEFIRQQEDPEHKILLKDLTEKYANVALVNQGIIQRIRSLKGGDANKNAIVALDAFAALLPIEFSSGVADLKPLFV